MSEPRRRLAERLLAVDVDTLGPQRRRALRARLVTLLTVLDTAPAVPAPSTATLVRRLVAVVDPADATQVWLVLAVLRAALPRRLDVDATRRRARLDGLASALLAAVPHVEVDVPFHPLEWSDVRVVQDAVLVDVFHTAETDLATGIQRVARESVRRWASAHELVLVSWNRRLTAMREVTGAARDRALYGGAPVETVDPAVAGEVVVPWRCTYLLPELAAEPHRAEALEALARWSRSRTGMVGFDCVPITSAETTGDGMGGGFATMLGAAAHFDRIATISGAAATEYRGWRAMLQGTGLPGPEVEAISLPNEALPADADAGRAARDELAADGLPLVLVVGSHEPRKNHLAVLQAAENLWRQGLRFSLLFVGGNAWRSETFVETVDQLQGLGRPVRRVSGMSDQVLAGAYAIARMLVFPSLNEGFGLPLVEALACGTPVVTSGFGSMAEIAADGGALVVDPRDDASIASAIARLLTDDELHARLAAEARARPVRTWDTYADQTWDYFTAPVAARESGVRT